QGMQQGLQQGEVTILARLLSRRFGPLDARTRSRLEQASLEELERWSERILDAGSVDEVFSEV
ncbi:DUF4351 domain-containing protein, partial [Arthrospira platensis SPKY1]|nr:DUF4351 domain-containing protein [Arthrospira platensis SPKY1]